MSTSTRIKRVIPVALYTVFYLLCFTYLENRHVRYQIIDSSLDDKIPFCEYFIIPYLLWFLYIAVTVGYFLFFNENTTEFWSLILNLAIGMTLFLIVSSKFSSLNFVKFSWLVLVISFFILSKLFKQSFFIQIFILLERKKSSFEEACAIWCDFSSNILYCLSLVCSKS